MVQPAGSSSGRTAALGLGWALAICFILITGILLTQTNRLRGDVARERDRATTLTKNLAAEKRWSAVLSSPALRTSTFTLTPDADAGIRANAVVDPITRRAVVVFRNFHPGGGKVYALWALHGNTPAPLGRLQPDGAGGGVLRIEDVGDPADLSALAISLETDAPEGFREPAGPIVMIGSLGS
jgi:anti-sigma-K factor RskA